jgi:preprotein translocase subunit SecF
MSGLQDFRNKDWNIDFMGQRHAMTVLSVIAVAVSIISIVIRGFNFGLDFTGGTLIEVRYEQAADIESIRGQLKAAGYEKASVVNFGTAKDVLIRLQSDDSHLGSKVMAILQQGGLNVEKRREDHVGPQIGNELRDQGGIAMLVSLTAMMIYISLRFQLKFSIGATIATFHDIIVTLGCFSLFQWEFDLNSLAAVLTILGYTLHDKVVVGDRIRENFRKVRSGTTIQIINASLNETLGRTIITSGVTLLSVLGLFFFGGELLHGFSMAMIIGIVVGTYSSIYISANILVILKLTKKDMVLPVHEKGGTYDDGMP